MTKNSPVFPALNKKDLVFFVPKRLFAVELALSGIIVFVLKFIYILIPIAIVHITVAILEKKESQWLEILQFLLRLPEDKNATL